MDFHGRPMIAYTIEAARDSGCFDRVVVSTEDTEIADVARGFGAEIDQRAAELATDQARVTDICLELLKREVRAGRKWIVMACLYATAPMRTAADIRATVDLLEPGRCDFAMAVTRYSLAPHQALKTGAGGALAPMWPELIEQRASALPPLVVDNGSTYAVDAAAFELHKTFYGPNLRGYEMPRDRSIDIDTREDYEHALWMAARFDKSEKGPRSNPST
jgi:pseudaminic acid cytidylyltransferase